MNELFTGELIYLLAAMTFLAVMLVAIVGLFRIHRKRRRLGETEGGPNHPQRPFPRP